MADKKDLDEVFKDIEDRTNVQLFSNKAYVGIDVGWSRKGCGWGHFTLSCRLEDGMWHLDDECSRKETVIAGIQAAIPALVEQLYEKGWIKPEYDDDDYISLKITIPKEEVDLNDKT